MKIHHIGYLVDNIEDAVSEFENLGYLRLGQIKTDFSREIYILFLDNSGYIIELIQPISKNSPIYGLRKRYRNSPYHICYETSDMKGKISKLCEEGYVLINRPALAPAIGENIKAAFLLNDSIGIIELIESEENKNE